MLYYYIQISLYFKFLMNLYYNYKIKFINLKTIIIKLQIYFYADRTQFKYIFTLTKYNLNPKMYLDLVYSNNNKKAKMRSPQC